MVPIISIILLISLTIAEAEDSIKQGDVGVIVDHCSKTKYCGRGFLCCGNTHCCPNSMYCCWPQWCRPLCCRYPFFQPTSNSGCPHALPSVTPAKRPKEAIEHMDTMVSSE
uniref:Cysteine rich secreted protein n=1 Tax=Riptortus pedestris TaxID=329032 RepID=R4WN46_RIPPE|nr:cysteine rich secreted protein [Riptortus pedestris]